MAGSSGFIGAHLSAYLREAGYEVFRLVRPPKRSAPDCILWDPPSGTIERERLEGFDAVINLAGANVFGRRWTAERKHEIRTSRVTGARLLTNALSDTNRPPRVLLSASAVGYYGNRGDAVLDESEPPGDGFLADVCRTWEEAAADARRGRIRLVTMRLGLVLGKDGGVLGRMRPVFRMGLGGHMGDGRQYMSWIAMYDLLDAIAFLMDHESISGPVNMTAPHPVRQGAFTASLARVLSRPNWLHTPGWLLRALFGEAADELFLYSARVMPSKLKDAGFVWRYPDVEAALRHLAPF